MTNFFQWLVLLFISVLMTSCEKNSDSYDIYYVDLYSSYPVGLSCNKFYHKNDKDVDHLSLNPQEWKYFKEKIFTLKPASDKEIDVRMKGFIVQDNDTINLCASVNTMVIDDKYYIVDDSLRTFLEIVTDNYLAKIVRDKKKKTIKR